MIFGFFKNEASYDRLLMPYRVRADRIMVGMNVFLMAVCLGLAPIRGTFLDALAIGLPTLFLSHVLVRHYSGALLTRVFMGCAFMVYTGLIIHQTGGDIEGHFSAFGLVGVLLYYRDWRTVLAATVFIYLHHLVLGYAQTLGVPIYVFDDDRFWLLFGVHVAYFLPFIGMMMFLSIWLRREGYEEQRVIDLAQHIIQGNLFGNDVIDQGDIDKPLIHSVVAMKNRLLDLLKVMPVPAVVIRVNQARVVSVNEAWERTLGPIDDIEADFDKAFFWPEEGTWKRLLERLSQRDDKLLDKIEQPLRRKDGKHILCELSVILHEDVKPVMAIMTVEDVTERRQAEQTMAKLAYNDLLTGLPNRAHLQAVLDGVFNDWKDGQGTFAVAILDLDGFKPINDIYGHDAGDEVLKAVASRFETAKREKDVIARLGGDEFVLVIRGCSELHTGIAVAERLVSSLADPVHIRNTATEVVVGTSAGIAVVGPKDIDIDAVVKRADQALYQAKRAGKNQVRGAGSTEATPAMQGDECPK